MSAETLGDRWLTDTAIEPRFPVWTRGNASDVLPDPVTPLTWTLYWGTANARGVRDAYINFGMLNWDEFADPNNALIFSCFGGYFYNPVSQLRILGVRMPGASPDSVDKAFYDNHPDVPAYVAEEWHVSEANTARLVETVGWVMSASSLPRLDACRVLADRVRGERPDLAGWWEAALVARARAIVPVLELSFAEGMVVSMGASFGPGALAEICSGLGEPSWAVGLLAGIEVDSARPAVALWELSRVVLGSAVLRAEFDAGVAGLRGRLSGSGDADAARFCGLFEDFLARFGSRGPGEWDLNARAWELFPDAALQAVDLMRLTGEAASPAARAARAVGERDRITAAVRSKLAGDAAGLAGFEAALRSARVFGAGRERYKTTCITLVHEIRMCMLELGRKMVARAVLARPEQVFMLLASELDEFCHHPERFTDLLAQRESDWRALFELEPPFIVNGTVPPLSQWPQRSGKRVERASSGMVLRGTAGSAGVATGRARVVDDPFEAGEFAPGDILIAPETDPSWTPLFLPAAAVVVNVGALASHAVIVARELGIPCVVSVADATHRITDGTLISVDGNAGTITIHDRISATRGILDDTGTALRRTGGGRDRRRPQHGTGTLPGARVPRRGRRGERPGR